MEYGILCLAPVVVALVLCFVTKDALLSILLGVIVGTVIMGQNPVFGLSSILQSALGNADFIWVAAIEVFIGIMVAYFQKSGAIKAFADKIAGMGLTRRLTSGAACILGLIVYFSDYFSPLYVGNVMRPLTDKALISREKLAFICDCTSAPVACMLGPFASWGVYMAGLLVGLGCIVDADMGMTAVMKAVPFNFYCIIMFLFCLLNSFGIIPDFGPMKKAEKRALEEGKVVRDGAQPMLSKELGEIIPNEGVKASILLDFLVPALIIFSIILGTFIFMGSAKTLEAFIATVMYQFLRMLICKMATLKDLMNTAVDGIKAVLSAILILAMAYCINSITKGLGTADYIIGLTESFMTPALLVTVTFLTCAFISFLTGSSWGTFAIMTPIAIPLAFTISGGEIDMIVLCTIGAIEGGGTFGDHCSPMSDTTILSSLAAGSDHMDHNATQIPYAVLCAAITCAVTLVMGFML
ncbi:MAG: transporter [Firmicutes bacterium]|nr:transporter [Bacillota bacterium]